MIYFVDILQGLQIGLIALAVAFLIPALVLGAGYVCNEVDGSKVLLLLVGTVVFGLAAVGLPSKNYLVGTMSVKTLNSYCYSSRNYSACEGTSMEPGTYNLMQKYQTALLMCQSAQRASVIFGTGKNMCDMQKLLKLNGQINARIDDGMDY